MAPAGPDVRQFHGYRVAGADVTVPMILDGGDAARVAVICCCRAPYVGMRFVYGGTGWEVTHAGDHVRGWVAEPLPHPEAAPVSRASVRGARQGDSRARSACSQV